MKSGGSSGKGLWAIRPSARQLSRSPFRAHLSAQPTPIPLATFGIPTPNCYCHLQPGTIVGSVVVPFVPELVPAVQYRGGVADFRLYLPNQSWMFGVQLTTQWFELSQMATSNAITWTVAGAMPTLDMALIEGDPGDATGEVSVHLAHVLRLEYR